MTGDDYQWGRWMTPDQLGGDITNPQSLNRYAYVENNPTTYVDPLGLNRCLGSIGSCTVGNWGNEPDPIVWAGGEFGLQNIPIVVNTGIFVPAFPGQQGYDISAALSVGNDLTGGNSLTMAGINPEPGYLLTPTVGNAFMLSGPAAGFQSSPGGGQSWAGTFAKSFFSTQSLSTAWHSLTSPNGCNNLLFKTFARDLNPIPTGPSLADIIKPAADLTSAAFVSKALHYAASQPNFLGGTGLLYPFKSSVVQGLMGRAQAVEDIVPEITIGYATGDAVISDIVAAARGECH